LAQTIFNRDKSMADDLNAKFTLKAQTEGGEQIREIADDVRSVGDGAHEASPRMTELGDAATRTGGNLDTAGQAARALGKYLATAFTARELVQAAAEMEKLRAGLQAVAGDADKAAKELAFVRDIAARAGVDVADASKAYLGLAAATKGTAVEGQATRDVFEAVSVAMARAGKSSGETANALLALQQMAGKGVVSMEEMRQQLGEALPGAFQAAAKGMGVTTQELIKLIETGQVTAQDIFPALTRGLNELYAGAPQAQTLAQEITNIKNAFVEMADNIGQAGGGNALKAFAEGAQTALTFLDAALVATGKKIGVLVGAFAAMDFSGLKTAFAEIESEAQTKLAKAAQHNDVLRASLQAVGGEATQAALAMQQAGAAAQQGAAQADASAVSYQALGAAYKKVRDELAQQIDLAERDVKAAKARGDAAVAQARLLGDEAALRAAIGQAAQGEAQALATLAQQRQTEVDVLRAELNNKLALLAAGGQVSDERKKELQALEALIAQKQIDADATAAQAAAAQASARAKGPEAQAAEQVRVAAQASAVARKSEADAAINLLAHSRGLAQQSEQMARLMGDETSARRERIRQMEIDAQITRAKAEVQRVEAEGSIAVARATLAEMAAKGEANAVKQAELEASIKLAEARLKEVDLLKQAASAAEFAVARQRSGRGLGPGRGEGGGRRKDGRRCRRGGRQEARAGGQDDSVHLGVGGGCCQPLQGRGHRPRQCAGRQVAVVVGVGQRADVVGHVLRGVEQPLRHAHAAGRRIRGHHGGARPPAAGHRANEHRCGAVGGRAEAAPDRAQRHRGAGGCRAPRTRRSRGAPTDQAGRDRGGQSRRSQR